MWIHKLESVFKTRFLDVILYPYLVNQSHVINMEKNVKSFIYLWSPWHCECSYEKFSVNGQREPVELAKPAPTASHFKAQISLFPYLLSGNLSTFLSAPGVSTHEVLYTDIWGFSRRTKVLSRLFRARPCWFIAKFGELQHQRLFLNGCGSGWLERTVILLKICDFWVYNTQRVDIPGETQKKLVVPHVRVGQFDYPQKI